MNIYCQFEKSVDQNIEMCKFCKMANDKISGKHILRICPVLLHQTAMNPEAKNINLVSVSEYNLDGTKNTTLIDNSNKFFNSWWNNSLAANNYVQNISNTPNTSQQKENTKQCTQEQIDYRMNICKSCEFFKDNTCLKCGCALSRERNYMNKLYYPDKSCPIGKWGPVE